MDKIVIEVTESQFELLTKALEEYKEKCRFMANEGLMSSPIMKMMKQIAGPELEKLHADKKKDIEATNILIGKLYFDKNVSEQATKATDQASQQ